MSKSPSPGGGFDLLYELGVLQLKDGDPIIITIEEGRYHARQVVHIPERFMGISGDSGVEGGARTYPWNEIARISAINRCTFDEIYAQGASRSLSEVMSEVPLHSSIYVESRNHGSLPGFFIDVTPGDSAALRFTHIGPPPDDGRVAMHYQHYGVPEDDIIRVSIVRSEGLLSPDPEWEDESYGKFPFIRWIKEKLWKRGWFRDS